jgi:predicted HAD superfamily Cof-like phosphohydrolase
MKLRANLIYEEVVRELLYHMGYYITIDPIVAKDTESSYEIVLGKTYCEPSLPEIADGIVDSIVVLLGAACAMGIDIQPIWDKIHESNMAKATGPVREDGKRLKPENWQPPDIESELKKQGWSGK